MLLNSIFPELEYAELYKGFKYDKVKKRQKQKLVFFCTPSNQTLPSPFPDPTPPRLHLAEERAVIRSPNEA